MKTIDGKLLDDCDDGCPHLFWGEFVDACRRKFTKGANCRLSNREISSGFSCGGIPPWCELKDAPAGNSGSGSHVVQQAKECHTAGQGE
jgi:hypothetical protein